MGLGLVGVWVTFLISSLEAIGQIWQKVSVQVKGSFKDFGHCEIDCEPDWVQERDIEQHLSCGLTTWSCLYTLSGTCLAACFVFIMFGIPF